MQGPQSTSLKRRRIHSLLSPRLFVCYRYICPETTASMNLKGGRETVDAKTSVGRKSISRQKREETENNFNCFRGPPARGWGGRDRLGIPRRERGERGMYDICLLIHDQPTSVKEALNLNRTERTVREGSGSGSGIFLNWTDGPVQGSAKSTSEPD